MTNTPSPPRMHPLARADLKSPGGRPRSQPDLLEHTRAMMFSPTPSNVRPWTRGTGSPDGSRAGRPRPARPTSVQASRLPALSSKLDAGFASPLLAAEVSSLRGSREERGTLAMQLLRALAEQPSPVQPLLARCVDAIAPCVFATSGGGDESRLHVQNIAAWRADAAAAAEGAADAQRAASDVRAQLAEARAAADGAARREAAASARAAAEAEAHAATRAELAAAREAGYNARRAQEAALEAAAARASSNELQLERQIEDLVEAQWAERRRLQMLEVRERNGAVCGPEEFAALQAKQQAVLQQLAASRAAAMDLHEQIGTLEQKLAAEEAKNASLRREIADAMASRTPRPDWAGVQKLATTALKVGLRIENEGTTAAGGGGGERLPLAHVTGSVARVEAIGRALRQLHADLTQQNRTVPSQGPFFKTLGEGADVPAHLRWAGKQRLVNRRWGKRETHKVVDEVWKKKKAHDEQRADVGEAPLGMPEYIRYHFQQHYGVEHMVAESAHNLVDACKRYAYDADMALFLEVLHGRADEREHDEQVLLLQHLREAILEADKDHYGMKAENKIPRDVLHALLPSLFASTSAEGLAEIGAALDRSYDAEPGVKLPEAKGAGGRGVIRWPLLFEADRDGNQSAFVECIRSLHLQEPSMFVAQLTAQIAAEQLRGARAAGDSIDVVSLPLLFAAVAAVDPHRSHADVARLIGAALRRDPSTLRPEAEAKVPIELVGFLRRVTRLRPRFSAGPR